MAAALPGAATVNILNERFTMKFLLKTATAGLFIIATSLLFAEDALTIMQKNDALPEAQTVAQRSVLTITKAGRSEKKEFSTISKKYDRKKRSRISVSFPTKMEFLSWDIPGEDNQQWIKLSSGKVRKIASSEKNKPWMNSHFYYDDIATSYIEDYDYRLIGEESCNGTSCYKIESVKKRGQKVYSKKIIYVGKADYLVYRVQFYENDLHTKTLTFSEYRIISGIALPHRLTMERSDGKGTSVLQVTQVTLNGSVNDRNLTQEGL